MAPGKGEWLSTTAVSAIAWLAMPHRLVWPMGRGLAVCLPVKVSGGDRREGLVREVVEGREWEGVVRDVVDGRGC